MDNVVSLDLNSQEKDRKTYNFWLELLGNLRRNRSAMTGFVIIALLILMAILAPVIATHDPLTPMFGQPGETPPLPRKTPCIYLLGCSTEEAQHLMGLDLNARDLFSRIVYGSRTSLVVGIFSVSFAIVIGTLLGL
ncbi:MAG: hypothetical protein K8I60_21340, partial [Anaerolineae bacterium]|nr:hypothetical protein [Anaerolineae bacterium]